MEDIDDDFGELYADFEVQATSIFNGASGFSQLHTQQHQRNDESRENDSGVIESERREKNSETIINGVDEVGVIKGSESDDDDDDFDVVVNDEEIEAKYGGGDGRRCCEEAEDMEVEVVDRAMKVNMVEKDRLRGDINGMEQSNGGLCSGERGNVAKNGRNAKHKYLRRYGSDFVGNQRAVSSRKAEGEDAWYGQPGMSGSVPGLAGNGNNFWLPWYRTIVDVDIDTFRQKSWTHPGADITDYFNFGFDEESWRNYCQSLDQLRRQTLSQTRKQVDESLRLKLDNEAGATKELESERFGYVDAESIPSGLRKLSSHELDFAARQFKKQFGQAIYVENSNTERQPSTDARRPRNRDSDVIIQIIVKDPEEPSSSVNEDPDSILEAEKPDGLKAYELEKISVEENFRSTSASSGKRSYESAAVSSYMLQDSNGRGNNHDSELDIELSRKEDTFSGGNRRPIGTLNRSMEDVDRNSTEINPCVAGIDFSSDDHGCSSPSPSYSNTWPEAPSVDDHSDSRRTQDLRRSSSDSMKERYDVAKVDYHHLRSKRDDKKAKDNGNEYHLRIRDCIKDDLKHKERRVRRQMELKSHTGEDDKYRYGIAEHRFGVNCSRAHHFRREEWCLASDEEFWPSHRENKSSLGCYTRRSVENQYQAEPSRDLEHRDHWRSRDEVEFNYQRGWDKEQLYSDRRMRRMRGAIVKKDWRIQEKEFIIRDEKPLFQNQQDFMSKISSSHDINRFRRRRNCDNIYFNNRSKHGQPLQYRHFDGPVHNRNARPNPLNDRRNKYLESEFKHERHYWHSGEVGTGYEYFEGLLNVNNPRPMVDGDADEYWNRQTSTPTHDYSDEPPSYGDRRHQSTLYGDDADEPELYQKYESHSRSISAKKGTCGRQVYGSRDAFDRHDAARYLDEDDFYDERRNVFLSKGMSWTEDKFLDGYFYDDVCGENMLDSFKGIPRHKFNGVKHGFVPGGMAMHTQIMKGRFGVVENGGGKFYSKMSTRAKYEENGKWGRNLVKLRHTVRKRKTLQSTGKFSKPGTAPNEDACEHADGNFREQCHRQREQGETFPDKTMENKALSIEASWNNLPVMNHDNTSDPEEGQLLSEMPKLKKYDSGHLAQKDTLKRRSNHCQKLVSQCGGHIYDENRILETMAKMEKRRERFKEPVHVKKDTDSDLKPGADKLVETAESKGQRPARKRKWG